MFSKLVVPTFAMTAIFAAVTLAGCGTSSAGVDGSKHQTATGVAPSGYPGGQPKDATSPALASSSESANSDAGKPKVPKDDEEKPAKAEKK